MSNFFQRTINKATSQIQPQSTQLMSRQQILTLYKQLLQQAKIFPSISRKAIYQGIQHDFKHNKHLNETSKLRVELARALDGLTQLQQYTQLQTQKGNLLSVDLSKTQPKGAGNFKPSDHVADIHSTDNQQSSANNTDEIQNTPEWLQKHKQRKAELAPNK